MTTEGLKLIVQNNLNTIFEPDTYRQYLEQSALLTRYDFINKFLIFFQNRRAKDVRSEIEWRYSNRAIADINNPMWILSPVFKTTYKDIETGEPLKDNDLNIDEIERALELGIIIREKYIVDFESAIVYDKEDTVAINDMAYKNLDKNQKLKISSICALCKQVSNMLITTHNGSTTYDSKTNHLIIGTDPIEIRVLTLLKSLVESIVNRSANKIEIYANESVDEHLNTISNISSMHKMFIIDSVIYSLGSIYRLDIQNSFAYIAELFKDAEESNSNMGQLLDIMDSIENIKSYIINNIRTDSTELISIEKIKKAESFLNILEANAAMRLIKGGH